MPRKKEETVEETTETVNENEATDETAAESKADANETAETGGSEEPSVVDAVLDTFASAVEAVTETIADGITAVADTVSGLASDEENQSRSKRAEKVGIVSSDKMTKTVVVRVDRQVKHPIYRKYIKRRKKFMAHDELGSTIGDKVRIVETRPLSAQKRWRVVEILQKAEK